jgi:hypothetical protein
MSSQIPPTYYFSNIDYNPSYYEPQTSGVSLDYANSTYLRKIGVDTSTAYTTFKQQTTLYSVNQATSATNTQFGDGTSLQNNSGTNNVAIGKLSLSNNTIGYNNTAIGYSTMNTNLTGYDNTAIGNLALSDHIDTFNGTTALGSLAGRNSLGSNCLFLGHQSGQTSSDANTYNYLTCIGVTSGRDPTICSSNRMILGSVNGNENYLFAGSGDFAHRDLTKAINLFITQTGTITIGNTTSTSNISIGQFVFSWGSSIATIQNTGSSCQFQGQPTGSTRFGGNQTFGNLTFGSNSASTSGGTTTLTSANGTITIGSTPVTTANINIGNSLTTGNITLGNSGATGTGSIVCNRQITLPTSTSYTAPTAGTMLGGFSTITATLGSASFTAGNLVGSTAQNIATFTFPSVGTYHVKIRIVFSLAGGSSAKIGLFGLTSTSATMPTDPQVLDDYYYNGTLYNGSTTMMDFYGKDYRISVTNAATTYYIVGQMGVNTGETITISSCSVMPMRIA